MKGFMKFIFFIILVLILFGVFVYFGGGTAVKYVGNEVVAAGNTMENLETQMKRYIQNKINRIHKIERTLLNSEPGR